MITRTYLDVTEPAILWQLPTDQLQEVVLNHQFGIYAVPHTNGRGNC